MTTKISIFVTMLFLVSGCDAIKNMFSKSSQDSPEPAAITETMPESQSEEVVQPSSQCEDGSEPQVLSGDCSGVWSVQKTDSETLCHFEWGPKVDCPEGTKSISAPGACYGVNAYPVDSSNGAPSAQSCLEQFGETPKAPKYELLCCPV